MMLAFQSGGLHIEPRCPRPRCHDSSASIMASSVSYRRVIPFVSISCRRFILERSPVYSNLRAYRFFVARFRCGVASSNLSSKPIPRGAASAIGNVFGCFMSWIRAGWLPRWTAGRTLSGIRAIPSRRVRGQFLFCSRSFS